MAPFALALVALALQGSVTVGGGSRSDSARRARRDSLLARLDSIGARRDSIREARRREPARRIAVTPELVASAFRDDHARALLTRARQARLVQDSTLASYDATAYQRISAGLGFRAMKRDRLIFRHESVTRVRWQRGSGVWVDVKGARTVIPVVPEATADLNTGGEPSTIPYYPGRDALWMGVEVAKSEVDEREIVHPLAAGSEAYYRYAVGDAAAIRLPDGRSIELLELRVEARRPQWNLMVGSLWFDRATAQLVRAAYRPAVPLDIVMLAKQEGDDDDIPRWLRPMTATIKAVTVEYGLHQADGGGEGLWWLPRTQYAEGEAQVGFMRVPVKLEESFRYASVNGVDSIPSPSLAVRDTTTGDSAATDSAGRPSYRRWRQRYDDGDARVTVTNRYGGALRVTVRTPKDSVALVNSPELPASIYDSGEDVFGAEERAELIKSLDIGLQAGWSPQRPTLLYGAQRGLLRYNRVEGLSAGIGVEQVLGRGYTSEAIVRLGTSDLEPNGEVRLRRSDGRRTFQLAAYRRLAAANDWGEPLGLGASLSAVLFGRDEGFYYRTLGAELTGLHDRGPTTARWRLFLEGQRAARLRTHFSLANAIGNVRFIDNIRAERGMAYGASAGLYRSFGVDPRGWRAVGDVRGEAAVGDFRYVRGSAELTLSRDITRYLSAAVTGSGGSTGGTVPVQRQWYLGGTHTVRGHPAGSASGDAYWLGRAELGTSFAAARPVVFYDVGWAGPRNEFGRSVRPLAGAGVGASFVDGLVRFDLAKGIRPRRGWRADLYVEARF